MMAHNGKNHRPHQMGQAERLRQMQQLCRSQEKALNEVGKNSEHYRRLLWMVVSENNGRIEIPEAVYRQVMQTPPMEIITKLEPDAKNKMVALINCDEEGDDLGRIIVPKGMG